MANINGKDLFLPTRPVPVLSLFTVEKQVFENCIKYTLSKDKSFASYFYHNTLYAFNLDSEQVKEDGRWQSRLSRLIEAAKFNDGIAIAAFYHNRIEYEGSFVDTTFVPKYPITEIRKVQNVFDPIILLNDSIEMCVNHNCDNFVQAPVDAFTYRDALDVNNTNHKIDKKYKSFFSVSL